MESALHEHETVAVIVSNHRLPFIQGIAEHIGSRHELDGEVFLDSGNGDWLGFYDWLRATSGQIIGIRIWLDVLLPQLPSLMKCQGVELIQVDRQLLIFFGHEKHFDEALSCDQDFCSNQLLLSISRFALTFNGPGPS